jgi:hypothetical protein
VSLAHSPASIIGKLFEGLATPLGTDPALSGSWPIYIGSEPDLPDSCITLYDTQGRTQGRDQTSGEMIEFHGFQVRVRGATHTLAETKIYAISESIDINVKRDVVTLSGTQYLVHAITRASPVSALGRAVSGSRRFLFTLNAIASIHKL